MLILALDLASIVSTIVDIPGALTAAIPEPSSGFWNSTVVIATITVVGAVIERRHTNRMHRLERLNSSQHGSSYSLLESMDRRAIATSEAVDGIKADVGGLLQWQVDHDRLHDRQDQELLIERSAVVVARTLIERGEQQAAADIEVARTTPYPEPISDPQQQEELIP